MTLQVAQNLGHPVSGAADRHRHIRGRGARAARLLLYPWSWAEPAGLPRDLGAGLQAALPAQGPAATTETSARWGLGSPNCVAAQQARAASLRPGFAHLWRCASHLASASAASAARRSSDATWGGVVAVGEPRRTSRTVAGRHKLRVMMTMMCTGTRNEHP